MLQCQCPTYRHMLCIAAGGFPFILNQGPELEYPSQECCYQPYSQWQHNISYWSELRPHAFSNRCTWRYNTKRKKTKNCIRVFDVPQNMRNKSKQSLALTHPPILVSRLNCKTMLAILCLFFGVSWESEMRSREKSFQQDVLHRVNPSCGLSENWIRAHIYGLALLKYFLSIPHFEQHLKCKGAIVAVLGGLRWRTT